MKPLGCALLILCLLCGCASAEDSLTQSDYGTFENRARTALYEAFRCPSSMETTGIAAESLYTPALFDGSGRIGYDYSDAAYRQAVWHSFQYQLPDGIKVYAYAIFDRETGELVKLSMSHSQEDEPRTFPNSTDSITQETIDAVIQQVEESIGLHDLNWHVMREDTTATNWGLCLPICALVTEDWRMTVYIGCDDGQLRGLELIHVTLVDALPEEDLPNG